MPVYDFRCEQCREPFSLRLRTVADYAASTPQCPACASQNVRRIISRVAISGGKRDYRKLSSNEMLSVLESGDKRQVETMFSQVTGSENGLPAKKPD